MHVNKLNKTNGLKDGLQKIYICMDYIKKKEK